METGSTRTAISKGKSSCKIKVHHLKRCFCFVVVGVGVGSWTKEFSLAGCRFCSKFAIMFICAWYLLIV